MKTFTKSIVVISAILLAACGKQAEATSHDKVATVLASPVDTSTPAALPAPVVAKVEDASVWKQMATDEFKVYFLRSPTVDIQVYCRTPKNPNSDDYSEIILTDRLSKKNYNSFKIKFGKDVTPGPIVAGGLAGEENFMYILNKLRSNAKFEIVVNGKAVSFEAPNAKDLLPNPKDGAKFSCKTENQN